MYRTRRLSVVAAAAAAAAAYIYIYIYIYICIYRLRQVAGGHRALRDPVLAQRPPPRALHYTII